MLFFLLGSPFSTLMFQAWLKCPLSWKPTLSPLDSTASSPLHLKLWSLEDCSSRQTSIVKSLERAVSPTVLCPVSPGSGFKSSKGQHVA